ncbi:MBL fold metallo-hydrolase [Candidatus Nitrospira bockiana]
MEKRAPRSLMRLTVLGSGTNLHPSRAGAGYLVETDHAFLLDLGPRSLTNLIATPVDRHAVQYLLFSHFHADHFSDFITYFFDEVYYSRHVGRRPDVTIIGPRGTRALFRTILSTFPSFNRAAFRVRMREVADRPFRIGETTITPRTVTHSASLHCVGYRLEYRGRVLAYSGDAQYCRNLVALCDGANAAVVDCSYPVQAAGPGHLHAEDCGRIAHEAGVGRLVLSHFYPVAERYDVKAQAGERFSGRITKARDLLRITL